MVYWNPEDDKKRLEQRLRRKREERAGFKQEEVVVQEVESVGLGETLEALERQKMVSEQQSQQIKTLTDALTGQTELLRKILENQEKKDSPAGEYQVIYKPADINKKEAEAGLPSLNDYDVNVIDTSGIEVGMGKAGEKKSTGDSIKEKAARLRALRNKKKEK